jgi:hypothetical protein
MRLYNREPSYYDRHRPRTSYALACIPGLFLWVCFLYFGVYHPVLAWMGVQPPVWP